MSKQSDIKTGEMILKKMHKSLKKHFGPKIIKQLKATPGWDFFTTELLNEKDESGMLWKVAAINVRLPEQASMVRALWEGIDDAPIDETTRQGFKVNLKPMVENLKSHSAYEVIFEAAMGREPFPLDVGKAILILEQMVTPPATTSEEDND